MRCALLGEGSSDRALVPILRWLLAQITDAPASVEWIDTTRFQVEGSLSAKVAVASLVHPCDILFVHRDADRQGRAARIGEIGRAAGPRRHVAVVPVRTTEAWLLIEEQAIREAAGRPNGRDPLDLPSPARIEDLGDPKATLHQALRTANGRAGRRADRFHPESAHHRLADLVRDWSPLRQLPAFRALEEDTRSAMVASQVPVRSEED